MNWKQRFSAMAVHGLFSLALLLLALFLVFYFWYPAPLDKAMGVAGVFWIILAIDIILGPLLTFAVFNPKKKELKIDLAVIVAIQVCAFVYGLHTVAEGRPVFKVFVVDDIELVRKIDLKYPSDINIDKVYDSHIFLKPQWVSAVYSSDPKIAEQQKQEEMFGNSLASRPETYQPIKSRSQHILEKLKPLHELNKFNTQEMVEQKILAYQNKKIAGYLPVKGLDEDLTALFDSSGKPIAVIDLRPW